MEITCKKVNLLKLTKYFFVLRIHFLKSFVHLKYLMLRVKWNSGWHRWCGEVFLRRRSRRAGSLLANIGVRGLAGVSVLGSGQREWWGGLESRSLHWFYYRFPPGPWANQFSLFPSGCAHGRGPIAPFCKDFCSFENEKEHPRESRAGDVTAHIQCCRNTELVPVAALAAGRCLAWPQRHSFK